MVLLKSSISVNLCLYTLILLLWNFYILCVCQIKNSCHNLNYSSSQPKQCVSVSVKKCWKTYENANLLCPQKSKRVDKSISSNIFILFQVLLVTLSPQLKVVFTHPLKGSPSSLPLLAWQFVIIQVNENDRVIDPVLAFARESTIFFHQVRNSSDY